MARRIIQAQTISPGIATGTLCFVDFRMDTLSCKETISHKEVDEEISRFEKEADSVIAEMVDSVEILKRNSLFEEADVVQTHIAILQDDIGFRDKVREKIRDNRLAAELALEHVLQEIAAILENSENALFAQRAADLRDVELRLRRKLNKEDSIIISELLGDIKDPILAIKELFPSLVLEARARGINGFIVRQGTSLSHAAILAKSFGLPVVAVENFLTLGVRAHTKVVIDAISDRMIIDPSQEDVSHLATPKHEAPLPDRKTQVPVKLWINVVDPLQVEEADMENVRGIGLYRTEFLFMGNREDFPTEEEQYAAYSSLFQRCKGKPVTIRTLDIGGDKIVPYFSLGPQENPYLGFRAHRIFRFHPEIFITQMRAILRAGLAVKELRILYPMIETVDELCFVQCLLKETEQSLRDEGVEYKNDFQEGVLLEVPSAIWGLSEVLERVDFASIGTNDLFQYFFAVDRNNANVREAHQPQNPVALRMLKEIASVSEALNKPISICGEIASDASLLPVLVGLGFNNLSIDPNDIPVVRKQLLSLDISECIELAEQCLLAKRTDQVKSALRQFNSSSREIKFSHGQNGSEIIDPVCKMVVDPEHSRWSITRDGWEFHFCCKECRDRFMKGEV